MLRTSLFAAVLALFAAGPVLAAQCPMMMGQIDEALATAELSEADMERVTQLRAEGEELHNAGDHAASEAALAEAKEILGIE